MKRAHLVLPHGAERPRGVNGQLAAQHVLADVERGRARPRPRSTPAPRSRALRTAATARRRGRCNPSSSPRPRRRSGRGWPCTGSTSFEFRTSSAPISLARAEALGSDVDRDDPRAHVALPSMVALSPTGPWPNTAQGVASRDVNPLESTIGRPRPARDRGTFLEAHLVGKRHHACWPAPSCRRRERRGRSSRTRCAGCGRAATSRPGSAGTSRNPCSDGSSPGPPTARPVTPGPSAVTRPHGSWPAMTGPPVAAQPERRRRVAGRRDRDADRSRTSPTP